MYAAPPPTSENPPHLNGHLSPSSIKPVSSPAIASDSESALSDAVEDPATFAPILDAETPENRKDDDRETFGDGSSPEDDAFGSDDPDYNAESPAPNNPESHHNGRSSSEDTQRQRKRKHSFDTDEHMRNDPALYGIRRSVRGYPH